MKCLPVVSSVAIAVAACAVGRDSDSASLHFDAPKDAYAAFAEATKNDDWQLAANALNDESQAMMGVSMAFGASIMAGADDDLNQSLKELMAKHGIDMDAEPEEPADTENYVRLALSVTFTFPLT